MDIASQTGAVEVATTESGLAADMAKPADNAWADGLSFDVAIPRSLVHRASICEVFVTDSTRTGENEFKVAAQMPRGHAFGEEKLMHDFSLLVEIVRQAGVVVAHRYMDVPRGQQFIFRALSIVKSDLEACKVGPYPTRIVVGITAVPRRSGQGRLIGTRLVMKLTLDGTEAVEVDGSLLCMNPKSFERLRESGRRNKLAQGPGHMFRPLPAQPRMVGRRNPANVVITEPMPQPEALFTAGLVVDAQHPYLFDHPLDHVPGNLELEAARQLAVAAAARLHGQHPDTLTVIGMHADLNDFGELDLATRLEAKVGGLSVDEDRTGLLSVAVEVSLTQAGSTLGTISVEVAQCC
jgi:hypothetical protein